MFKEPVVYVDIETTGMSSHSSRIIEFAAIRVENDVVTKVYKTLIHPGSPIPYHITNITGITDHDVANAPYFESVATEIFEILDGAIFIAHNVRFDYSFIKRQLELCNTRFNPRMLCSVRMSRALYADQKGHSLKAIISRHHISVNARHRAFEDAEAIQKFFSIAYAEHGSDAFLAAAQKQLKTQSTPPNMESTAFDIIPNSPGVYTFHDKNDIPIYIGKSITLRKRVMSHFAQDTAIDKEMKLSLNTHSITHIVTNNELEALLLESQMIKQQLPVYNRRLRRLKKMYVLRAKDNEYGYRIIDTSYVDSKDIGPDSSIYGTYASKMKAKNALEMLQKTYDLCPKLMGIENGSGLCFKSQLGKCYGACQQREPSWQYNERFETAFEDHKITVWPFESPVIVQHKTPSVTSKHLVIDNWNVIGEILAEENCEPQYKPLDTVFDIDTYKIIRSYIKIKSAQFNIQPISYSELELYG